MRAHFGSNVFSLTSQKQVTRALYVIFKIFHVFQIENDEVFSTPILFNRDPKISIEIKRERESMLRKSFSSNLIYNKVAKGKAGQLPVRHNSGHESTRSLSIIIMISFLHTDSSKQ